MVNFRTHAKSFSEIRCADRHDHAFLDIDVVVCMCAAIHDVHHWYRQVVCVHAAEVLIQRKTGRLGCCMSGSEGDAENRICTKTALIFGAVEIDQDVVKASLVAGIPAKDRISDFAIDVVHSLQHAFAVITVLIAVTELSGFEHAGGCTGRYSGSGEGAVFELHIDFDSRVSTGIQNFSCVQISNCCHCSYSFEYVVARDLVDPRRTGIRLAGFSSFLAGAPLPFGHPPFHGKGENICCDFL